MALKYTISIRKLRRLERDGHLRVDNTESAVVSEMRSYLNKGNPLPAKHLLTLYETPLIRMELGKQIPKADAELAALGDARSGAAPYELVASIPDAAEKDPVSIFNLTAWLMRSIPAQPVNHAWIAVRLLINCPESLRTQIAPLIPRAMLYCRGVPEFAAWWRVENASGKNSTIYQRPASISLDL
jgi:hypothetical protein